jgi:hypothetical protein
MAVVEESRGESIGGVAGAVLVALVVLAILRRWGRSARADEEQAAPAPSRPQPVTGVSVPEPSLHPERPTPGERPPPPSPAGEEPRDHPRLSSEEMIARAKRRITEFGSDR